MNTNFGEQQQYNQLLQQLGMIHLQQLLDTFPHNGNIGTAAGAELLHQTNRIEQLWQQPFLPNPQLIYFVKPVLKSSSCSTQCIPPNVHLIRAVASTPVSAVSPEVTPFPIVLPSSTNTAEWRNIVLPPAQQQNVSRFEDHTAETPPSLEARSATPLLRFGLNGTSTTDSCEAGTTSKKRKQVLPKEKFDWLKERFLENPRPSKNEIREWSSMLGLERRQVRVFFENKRQVLKRRLNKLSNLDK